MSPAQCEKMKTIASHFHEIGDAMRHPPLTLCHGDMKAPNICRLLSGELCFLDWQYAGYGKGVQDLVFFLIESNWSKHRCCMTPLREYYNKLSETLPVKNPYSLTDFTIEYQLASLHFPFMVAVWFGSMVQLHDPNFPIRFLNNLMSFYDQLNIDVDKLLPLAAQLLVN